MRTTSAVLGLIAALAPVWAHAQSAAPGPGFELPPGIDLTLPGDAGAPPARAPAGNDPGIEIPGGLDLDVVPLPGGGADGQQAAPENPLDRDFDAALDAYRGTDYAEARAKWRELADAGHELSAHNLAVLVWRGQGGPQDRIEAVALFQEAESRDVPQSAHALGVINLRGIGVVKDTEAAMRHFEAASRLGWAPATYNLALGHFQGIGVPKDPDLGMTLLEAAAEGGLSRAQYDLAGLLYAGTYGAKDPSGARLWFRRAAEGGDPFAAYNLALMMLAGEGGVKDADDARMWLTRSAQAGTVPAQTRLGYVLAASGPDGDKAEALKWFAIAGALGDANALENAKRLRRTLDAKAVAAADAKVAAFRPDAMPIATPNAQAGTDPSLKTPEAIK